MATLILLPIFVASMLAFCAMLMAAGYWREARKCMLAARSLKEDVQSLRADMQRLSIRQAEKVAALTNKFYEPIQRFDDRSVRLMKAVEAWEKVVVTLKGGNE